MSERYISVAQTGESLFKDRGSKFLGFAVFVKNEEEIKTYLANWWKEHPQACHICYAFRLGGDKKHFRASDDGEPSNSAGPPILGQIVSFDVTNVLVAVVRYYGGVNLGVGGLITAYRTAAKDALEQAELFETEDYPEAMLTFEYSDMPKVMQFIKQHQLKVLSQTIELSCSIHISYPKSFTSSLEFLSNLPTVSMKMV